MAYRIHMPEKSTFNQDCDDDGESCAGGRLLNMMQVCVGVGVGVGVGVMATGSHVQEGDC